MNVRSSLCLLLASVPLLIVAACSSSGDAAQTADAQAPEASAPEASAPEVVADAATVVKGATSCADDAQAPGISTCGASGNESCCLSPTVTGGMFLRDYDGVTHMTTTYPATVSSFRLDKFEVTVGRFRSFATVVAAGWSPAAGSGKHTYLNGGKGLVSDGAPDEYEPGWDSTWTPLLAKTAADWTKNLSCSATYQTWSPDLVGDEARPINCASWFEAYAFCIWDGGFLPSAAEWSYAAEGGMEQRVYPWSSPPMSTTIDCTLANFGGAMPLDTVCVKTGANRVGSEPKGYGKWGPADLAGNVWEWALDWSSGYVNPCKDCGDLDTGHTARGIRGGGFSDDPSNVLASYGLGSPPDTRDYTIGFRCARAPSP